MINKIRSFLESLSNVETTKEFKSVLFNNFFQDPERLFLGSEHIEKISHFCFQTLLLCKNKDVILNEKTINNNSAYCIVMKDRPFVTDSVLNFIHSETLIPSVFIHPNVYFDNEKKEISKEKKGSVEKYSIIYFEIKDALSKEQFQALEGILNEVYLATQSYSEMKAEILKFGEEKYLNHEINDFIKWICDEAFVILGTVDGEKQMGICTLEKYSSSIVTEPKWKVGDLVVTKSLIMSSIHRSVPLDIILIRNGEISFKIYGMFTTHSYKEKLLDVPIINTKVKKMLSFADFQDINYNRKELFSFLENLPRAELFSTSTEFLLQSGLEYINSLMRARTYVYYRQSVSFPLVKIVVFTPNAKFTFGLFKAVVKILQSRFDAKDIKQNIFNANGIERFVMSFVIRKSAMLSQEYLQQIVDEIQNACENAEDNLIAQLQKVEGINVGKMMKKYSQCFSASYTSNNNSNEIVQDIFCLEKISDENSVITRVVAHEGLNLHIKIYSQNHINLQKMVTILQNCGVVVSKYQPYEIKNDNVNYHIYGIQASLDVKTSKNLTENKEFINVICQSLTGKIYSTTLSRLAITSEAKASDIFMLRAYVKYLKQIQFQYNDEAIHETLALNPEITTELINLFYAKFSPNFIESREEEIKKIGEKIGKMQSGILDVTHDAIIRQLYKTIQGTVRTNFFLNKDYLSFKFDCKSIPNLPKPVPFREIFVYSLEFEAIHLRFGKVARGGLRWSDRHADFRTEVLGLVKAQNTKNAVIVPVGSKGGFVITPQENLGRNAYLQFGQECYKKFLSGCLDLCDNIITGKVVTPEKIVKWEDEDPYFVVAADKGTATFSDIANSVSTQYNFWLGDAFASGGSNGYDHKKMGITAKGAWVAARRHMMELGIDTEKQEFTCIGIGDLSGDVFGNGLLRSRKTNLIAAFNHLHIFIDPNPDAEKSFIERERMYNLPRSTWADYDKATMSKGSAIFERSAKTCKLTPEIKMLLEINEDEVLPDVLINKILKAKCDMIWNGGIGTYVKSSDEKHSDVGDKANNNIRVNGNELRCKVFAEGGNLGCTQKGRIEFARNGGKINTDAMDNSAGVNCSDVEVNVKILLNGLLADGKISLEGRNKLLEEMTPQVNDLVLRNNYEQTQAITIAEVNAVANLESQEALMKKLEATVGLDRENEFLPSTKEMGELKEEGVGLTRPELCVLFAYSKIYLYQELLKTSLIAEPYFEAELLSYFPTQMQEKFGKEILKHKLAKEIIATSINNGIVNRAGIVFVHSIAQGLQCKICDVVRAYVVVREIFALNNIWTLIEKLECIVNYQSQVAVFDKINTYLKKTIYIMLSKGVASPQVTDLISKFAPKIENVVNYISQNIEKTSALQRCDAIEKLGFNGSVSKKIAVTLEAMSCFMLVFENENTNLEHYLNIHYSVKKEISSQIIYNWIAVLPIENEWKKLAVRELEEKLQLKYSKLVSYIAKFDSNAESAILSWKNEKSGQIEVFTRYVNDISKIPNQDFAIISMLVDKLDILQ